MKKVVSSNWLLTTDVLEMVSEDTKGDVITSKVGKQKFCSHLSLVKVNLLDWVTFCATAKLIICTLLLQIRHKRKSSTEITPAISELVICSYVLMSSVATVPMSSSCSKLAPCLVN